MSKNESGSGSTAKGKKRTEAKAGDSQPRQAFSNLRSRQTTKPSSKDTRVSGGAATLPGQPEAPVPDEVEPIVVKHKTVGIPEGLPPKYFLKSTFNTSDIMHSPVEKTLKMLDKILAGERLFTM